MGSLKTEININDYVSQEDIIDIAVSEVRLAFRSMLKNEADIERILVNLSYEYIFKIVEQELNIHQEEFRDKIVGMCRKLLDDPSTLKYLIFRRKDIYERAESPAVKWLDMELENSHEKIKEEVNKRIEEYPFYELRENIENTIYECIVDMIRGRKDKT